MEDNKKMVYCRYCGKQIDEDAPFCTHCGKSQSNVVTTDCNVNEKKSANKKETTVKIWNVVKLVLIVIIEICGAVILNLLIYDLLDFKRYDSLSREEIDFFIPLALIIVLHIVSWFVDVKKHKAILYSVITLSVVFFMVALAYNYNNREERYDWEKKEAEKKAEKQFAFDHRIQRSFFGASLLQSADSITVAREHLSEGHAISVQGNGNFTLYDVKLGEISFNSCEFCFTRDSQLYMVQFIKKLEREDYRNDVTYKQISKILNSKDYCLDSYSDYENGRHVTYSNCLVAHDAVTTVKLWHSADYSNPVVTLLYYDTQLYLKIDSISHKDF